MSDKNLKRDIWENEILISSEEHSPCLRNISSAFELPYVLVPNSVKTPEYIYINETYFQSNTLELEGFISQWNATWEMGQLRNPFHEDHIPQQLKWLLRYQQENVYLVPELTRNRYYAYLPLLHLLPSIILKAYGLPLMKPGIWPHLVRNWIVEENLASDFDSRLSKAFAHYVWPLLNARTRINYFSEDEPIKVLAHNLDFWLPYVNMVIEERVKQFPRTEIEDHKQNEMLNNAKRNIPEGINVFRPLKGGYVWKGEEESWEVLKEVVQRADSQGKLRSLIDSIKTNRVEEDFSNKWSFEREDFERRLYKKRSKFKVKFVELNETIPVIGPYSEIDNRLFWQDFMTILDPKEKQIVVMLRNGTTNLTDIGRHLGYANHSPISKALRKIEKKLLTYE
ncbi:hypothetical protein YDYSY3_39420 [Paenibacillus chitinolyticus]|uniref:hypothetical protein n=1 Tax=Paenibacillus chitinolyticus TaxID=79263 RepID=UPI0026E4CFA2|nr:hypothetical protein [Paenibacillus chitinolyticus]GKS12942.1 hypothetical protein YDYSY3_39420 [Paenibacillus chitinolyticus]